MTTTIYGLGDLFTSEVFYIGATDQTLEARKQQHLSDYKERTPEMEDRLSRTSPENIAIFEIIKCTDEDKDWTEQWFIDVYRLLGAELINKQQFPANRELNRVAGNSLFTMLELSARRRRKMLRL